MTRRPIHIPRLQGVITDVIGSEVASSIFQARSIAAAQAAAVQQQARALPTIVRAGQTEEVTLGAVPTKSGATTTVAADTDINAMIQKAMSEVGAQAAVPFGKLVLSGIVSKLSVAAIFWLIFKKMPKLPPRVA